LPRVAAGGLTAIDRHLRAHEFVDLGVAVADFAQDFDAVAANERGGAEILARAGGKLVGKGEVEHLAFDRMLDLAEETDVVEMLVGKNAFERVDPAGGHVGLLQDIEPFRRGAGAQSLRPRFEIGAHIGEPRLH
jgi:hypothetical protein